MTALDLEVLARAPTSAMSEANLVHGYRGDLVDVVRRTEVARNQVEPCACGGSIEVIWPATTGEAVLWHNQAPEHVIWRRRRGIG